MSLAKRPLIVVFGCSISLLALANCSDSDSTGQPSAGSGGKAGASSHAGSGGKAGSGGAVAPNGGSEDAGAPTSGGSMDGGAAGAAPSEGGAGTAGGAGSAGSAGHSGSAGHGGSAGGGGGVVGDAGAGGDDGQPSGPHQNPILKYNFDEGTGLTIGDSSGSGFNASLSIAAWTAQGRHGAALSLSGGLPPTGFVSVPPGVFEDVAETTIASWVKLTSDTPWSRIFDFGGKGIGAETRFMYLAPNTPAGTRFSVFGGVDTREATVTTGTFLPLGVWKHVAVTAAANGKHAIYIDGFPAAEATTVVVPPSELEPMASDSWLGKSRFPDPGLNGALDEFTIYDRVLSPAEIAALAAPKADYARLAFDEATGTTASDTSDRAVNATLNGATWASGRLGAAVALSGTNQYVTLNSPLAGCTDQLTIALWVKQVAAQPWARIFDFGGTGDNFMFLTPSTDEGKMRLSIHTTAIETVVLSNTTLPADSTWHHVAVVINAAAATMFMDGAPIGTTLLPVIPSVLGTTNEHWLGKSRFPDPYFNGSFDELRISCRAFTPDEIKNLAFH